jgi:hypothetical protein
VNHPLSGYLVELFPFAGFCRYANTKRARTIRTAGYRLSAWSSWAPPIGFCQSPAYRLTAAATAFVAVSSSTTKTAGSWYHQTGETTPLELGPGGTVRELRCCCLTADDDSVHLIPIPNGMTPEQFRQKFDELGIKRFKEANLYADKEEIPWVTTLLEKLKYERKAEWSERGPGPITYGPLDIQITVNNRYFRDLAKIGFHYFLTKMSQFKGHEPCFAEIRRFITSECSIDECFRLVQQSKQQIAYQLQQGARLSAWGHILCAEAGYFNLTAKVQLFVGPEFLAPVYTVRLGRNPSTIHYSEAYADFFAYHPRAQRGEFDGEVSELFCIRGTAAFARGRLLPK